MTTWNDATALIVIDVQKGFDDAAFWGHRNNPDCEANIARLIDVWRARRWPVVFVKHNSQNPASPLATSAEGNSLKPIITGQPDFLVEKSVHSAFYGEPDLKEWLDRYGIRRVAITGIQTNMCCETTARMASDLGYELLFVEDATHTFDVTNNNGEVFAADDIATYTALTIAADFGRVIGTSDLVDGEFLDTGKLNSQTH